MLKILSNFRNPDSDPLFEYLRNNFSDKPITLFYERFPNSEEELKLNPYNFLMILEPNEFFGLHDAAIYNQHLFNAIITWDQKVFDLCDNGVLFTFNGRVLDEDFCNSIENKEKTFEVSFLCGDKNLVEGHKLRHLVHNVQDKITIPKKWYYVLDDYDTTTNSRPGYADYTKDLNHIPKNVDPIGYGKRVLFEDSMFNIVIENVKHNNWYNKIGDNFLSKTVPIYWGCPNVEDFGYDERGVIRFETADELVKIVNSLTPQTYYDMKPYIDYNYEVAKLDNLEDRLGEFFNQFCELNNI